MLKNVKKVISMILMLDLMELSQSKFDQFYLIIGMDYLNFVIHYFWDQNGYEWPTY